VGMLSARLYDSKEMVTVSSKCLNVLQEARGCF